MLVVLIGIIVSVFLAGCNSGAPTAGSYHLGQYNTTLDPNESVLAAKVAKYVSMIRLNPAQLKKMTLPELREVQKLMAAASLQMNQENQQIKILNCLYCEKIQEISGKCKVALPIIPTSSSAIPTTCNSCSGFVNSTIDPNYAKIQNHKIKVSLSLGNGGAGDYYLEANEVYKSSKFGPSTDEGTVVTFSSLGGAAANPPAWTGLTSLYVKQSNGKAMPAAADFSMSISIDGNPIVESSSIGYPTGSSFLNKDGKAIALEVDLASIFSVSQTQGICHPIPSFYSTAQYQAKQSVANAAKGASFYAPTGVDKAGIISDLVTSSKKLIGEKNTFTIEQNTNGRLQAALQAGAANGCVAGLDIKTVEFSLAGSVPGSTLITSDAGSAFPQVNPAQAGILQFTLGENLVFSAKASEVVNSSYSVPLSQIPEGAKIGGLDYLRVAKLGLKYNNDSEDHCSVLKAFDCSTHYEVYELDMVQISGITLQINGMKAYSRNGLSIEFSNRTKDKLHWTDSTFWGNPAWLKMMNSNNCNTTK